MLIKHFDNYNETDVMFVKASDIKSIEGVDLNTSDIAITIKTYNNSANIGVYIPHLMAEIDMGNRVYDKQVRVPNRMIRNDDKEITFEDITVSNYYTIPPYDPAQYYAEIELGEKVRLKFQDNDIKKCFYHDMDYKMTDKLMARLDALEEENRKLRERLGELDE